MSAILAKLLSGITSKITIFWKDTNKSFSEYENVEYQYTDNALILKNSLELTVIERKEIAEVHIKLED